MIGEEIYQAIKKAEFDLKATSMTYCKDGVVLYMDKDSLNEFRKYMQPWLTDMDDEEEVSEDTFIEGMRVVVVNSKVRHINVAVF